MRDTIFISHATPADNDFSGVPAFGKIMKKNCRECLLLQRQMRQKYRDCLLWKIMSD